MWRVKLSVCSSLNMKVYILNDTMYLFRLPPQQNFCVQYFKKICNGRHTLQQLRQGQEGRSTTYYYYYYYFQYSAILAALTFFFNKFFPGIAQYLYCQVLCWLNCVSDDEMALWKYSRYINNLTFIYTVDFLVIMAQYLKVSLDLTDIIL